MRLIAIGDIHGRDAWKKINPESYDKVIFVGDYADSREVHPRQVLSNLGEIIEFKKANPQKVILLLGNHDIQYSEFPRYPCTGFNAAYQPMYAEVYRLHKDYFQVAFQTGNRLFTHAGVSDHFARLNLADHYEQIMDHSVNLGELLNDIHQSYDQPLLHSISPLRGGYEPHGGITWADYRETSRSILAGYHQVVGHTPVKEITVEGGPEGSISYIDVLGTKNEFWTSEL